MDRREFLILSGGVLAGAALSAAAFAPLLRSPGGRQLPTPVFYAAAKRSGPAPTGLPYIALGVDDGVFVGKPQLSWRGQRIDTLAWLRYCGQEDAPGLQQEYVGTEKLSYWWRSRGPEEQPPWYAERVGQHISPADFPPGESALFRWRSHASDERPILGILMSIPAREVAHAHDEETAGGEPLRDDEYAMIRRDVFWDDFIAVSATCTHACCTLSYNDPNHERLWRVRNAKDKPFCSCHLDAWEPRRPVRHPAASPEPLRSSPPTSSAAAGLREP